MELVLKNDLDQPIFWDGDIYSILNGLLSPREVLESVPKELEEAINIIEEYISFIEDKVEIY